MASSGVPRCCSPLVPISRLLARRSPWRPLLHALLPEQEKSREPIHRPPPSSTIRAVTSPQLGGGLVEAPIHNEIGKWIHERFFFFF